MLEYVMTIKAEGYGDASKFFKIFYDKESARLLRAMKIGDDQAKLSSIKGQIKSLEGAMHNPSFVKDVRINLPSYKDGCLLVSKDGPYGSLTLRVYTEFGKINQEVRIGIGEVLLRLADAGFSKVYNPMSDGGPASKTP